MENNTEDVQAWIQIGIDNNWISPLFCNTHDGAPMTDEEEKEWEDGGDPCSFHVKVLDA